MIYQIFSDASVDVENKRCKVAYTILTKAYYLHSDNFIVKDITVSHLAECEALRRALEYFVNHYTLSSNDYVEIFVDSKYVYQFVRAVIRTKTNILRENEEPCMRPITAEHLVDIYDFLMGINSKMKVTKIRSHTGSLNAHAFVDRLTKVATKEV